MKLFEMCERFMIEAGSPNFFTRKNYHRAFRVWREYIGGDIAMSALTERMLIGMIPWALDRHYQPATINVWIAALRSALVWYGDKNPGFQSPARKLKALQIVEHGWRGFTEAERGALFAAWAAVNENQFSDFTWKAITATLYHTGLRIDECLRITVGQLSLDLRWIQGVRGKGNRLRDVHVGTEAREILARYLTAREQRSTARFPELVTLPDRDWGRFPLFVSFSGAMLEIPETFRASYFTVRDRTENEIGISSLHRFRHDFGARHADNVRLLAQQLGHSSLQSTLRYSWQSPDAIAKHFEGGE